MGIFGFRKRKKDSRLKEENQRLKKDNKRLRALSDEKDSFFMELMSEGLRKGSPLAAKHMADRKEYLKLQNKNKKKMQ